MRAVIFVWLIMWFIIWQISINIFPIHSAYTLAIGYIAGVSIGYKIKQYGIWQW